MSDIIETTLMLEPKISVVMPAYNAEKYIAETIDSILSQTFSDFEFIIINDASTDSTQEIIESYKDQRIQLINNEQNQGVAKSLNIGLAAATGKYIARMDADDISLPQRFQIQFDFMEQHPDIDICGSWMETFGSKKEIIKVPLSHEDIRDNTFFSCAIMHPSIVFKHSLNLRYSSEFPRAEDYDLWCKKINKWKFANIPEVLMLYRIHENQIGEAHRSEQDNNANDIQIRNIKDIGINLGEREKQIYLEIIRGVFKPKNKRELLLTAKMLDEILVSGIKHGYKQLFQDRITNFIKDLQEHGIQNKATSLKLYFTIFRKWKIFKTPKANLRYIYHCLRNLLHL